MPFASDPKLRLFVQNVAADGTNYHIGSGNAYANTNGIEPGDLGTASAPLYTSDPIPHLTNMVFRVCNAQPGSYLLAEHVRLRFDLCATLS